MKKIAFCSLLVIMALSSAFSLTKAQFRGIVINRGNDYIEIKKQKKEITVYLSPGTKILFHGKEVDSSFVSICQTVKAVYVNKDNKKELVSLDILKESYCTQ